MANTYISRTQANGTSSQKFTVSCWVKRSGITATQAIWGSGSATNDGCDLAMTGTDELTFESWDGSNNPKIITTRKFRDTSAWYHIVLAVDTTQATDTNRVKIYVNGVQETAFGTANYPSQNYNLAVSTTNDVMKFGVGGQYATSYWNGSMSHVHFVDGLQYAASDFGSTDSTTGEWTINTSPSVTYGTNGCFLLKDGNTITDSSSNSNNFTLSGGTLTDLKDCPDNVFATYNPLDNYFANSTFTNCNTTVATNTSNTTYNTTTLGIPPTMKCYWEVKFNSLHSANGEVGIVDAPTVGSSAGANRLYYQSFGISVNDAGQIWSNNSNTNITLGTLATSDIVCFAWDGVNQALYVRKNADAWINSGDPTSGASKTGTVKSFTGTRTMFPAVGDQAGNHSVSTSTNFGNGFFGTTAISSEGTNASGIGKFEYDVPAGYTALSTKGLNE